MSESCHRNLPCTCPNASEIIDNVKNKIERCIREYMNFDETVACLQEKHKISHHLTKIVWEHLQRESPEFFKNYHLKLEMTRHIKMFNGLLAKQVAMMIHWGEVDICNPSSAIVKFLCQDPEGTSILHKLATAPAYPEVSPSSLALTESNGPAVNQLQIRNDQQNQVRHYQWSTPNGFTDNHLGAPTVAPALTDRWFTSNGLTCNYPAASTVAPATTAQWSSFNNPAYIGAPTVAQAATMPQDPSTLGFGGNLGFNGLNFTVLESAQLLMQPENQLNGQYLPQLQLQNFSQQEQPTLQDGVSNNGIQHGGNNVGIMQPENQLQDLYGQYLPQLQLQQPFLLEELPTLQNGVSNSEPQYGGNNNWLQNGGSNNGLLGVIPESVVFNNSSNGDGTLTMAQIQHDLQRQQGLRGL